MAVAWAGSAGKVFSPQPIGSPERLRRIWVLLIWCHGELGVIPKAKTGRSKPDRLDSASVGRDVPGLPRCRRHRYDFISAQTDARESCVKLSPGAVAVNLPEL